MNYDSKSIKALSDLEAIRMRPGMYIGGTENPGHLFQEALDNSIDEMMNKRASKVIINVDSDSSTYTITDNGRGIPMGEMEIEIMGHVFKKQSLELITSKGHVGGKFDEKAYALSGGLHGIGLKTMSALSDLMTVETRRIHDDTGKWTKGFISYSKGKMIEHKYEEIKDKKSGTTVTIKADDSIFSSVSIPKSFIINKCKIARAFENDIELYIDKEKQDLGKAELSSLIESDEDVKFIIEPITLKTEANGDKLMICFQYTSDLSYRTKGFTNLIYNSQGGTHVRLFERTIMKAFRNVDNKNSILKDSDYLIGLRAVVACFMRHTSFSSQTKEKLDLPNKDFKDLMDNLEKELTKYLWKHTEVRDKLFRKFIAFRESQNKLLASKEIQGVVKVAEISADGTVRRKSIVAKLAECSTKEVEHTELFICEGDSAKSSLMAARDTRYHGVLPIRGKILNTAHLSLDIAIKNEEVLSIVNSIGCGIGQLSDNTKSRYGKIIVACDADPDGAHINALVVACLINLVPDMVKAGKVFIAESSLYGYYDKNGDYYPAYTKEEIPSNVRRWSRYKGLGELSPEETYAMFMDDSKRRLLQIEYPENIEEFNNIMAWSKKHLLEAENLLIDMR